ncbi:hypothetical protein DFH29DRAFT_978165 [Suillus ampliporus]|nr:hypothetical protein DFH29DRAFT_978165 [Suillus ampliporus]
MSSYVSIMARRSKTRSGGSYRRLLLSRDSGDITVLDWIGNSSEFDTCLPADITSYEAPPFTLSSLSEDEMQTSALRHVVAAELASGLYHILDRLSPPRFTHRRLHLPCIAFSLGTISLIPRIRTTK